MNGAFSSVRMALIIQSKLNLERLRHMRFDAIELNARKWRGTSRTGSEDYMAIHRDTNPQYDPLTSYAQI